MTRVVAVVALLTLGLLAPVAAARAADEDPPVVTDASVTPTQLPKAGGTVTITATVTDDVGVQQVYAEISGSDGSYTSVGLAHTTGSTYQGTTTIPGNGTEEERSYSIVVFAADAAQNYSEGVGAGEVSVEAQPQMDPYPWVSNTTVAPRDLPSGGGDVTIGAIATDNRSVNEVYAQVSGPDGFEAAVELFGDGTDHYEGVLTLPANPTASARQYSVTVYASDDIGQQDSDDGGTITVAPGGTLKVSEKTSAFGRVPIRSKAVRLIKVRNTGVPGSPSLPVDAVLTGSPAFTFGGPSSFRVKPGETRYLRIRFRPTAVGPATAELTINGTGPVVRLTGRGVAA